MPDIKKIIDQASIPSNPGNLPWLPWPELTKIDYTHNVWRFHYSDGHVETTRDAEQAERLSQIFFPNGPKTDK